MYMHASMKDLSFHFLKNSLGAKMRKGFRNFCSDHSSTSTLDQQHCPDHQHTPTSLDTDVAAAADDDDRNSTSPTLEQMILQLELEEAMINERNSAQLNNVHHRHYYDNDSVNDGFTRRMSCVNNSDILRSARNALNQYPPRFSLDGKDSKYRSSFRNLQQQHQDYYAAGRRKSICCSDPSRRLLRESAIVHFGRPKKRNCFPPPTLLPGDTVVWCKPGVIAKLMGLDAMPVPVANRDTRETLNRSRRPASHQADQRRVTFDMIEKSGNRVTSCSGEQQSWSIPRFRY
ncbi:hypothetical protein K2173_011023 [Erythroxylum novogranatense]|uniref:DUF3741 domain-containing protein n=1 Tax=Erythroxylum novogranatense TaxID=1862640 RepID=A0AAV8T0A6_9ROSI|nr:hypothetical protein K2173_011023 [Erythroxylum novogranatense]